jgi:hypothetical protein
LYILKSTDMDEVIKELRIPSFGEQLMGINIDNPEETELYKINFAFAEIAEKIKKEYEAARNPMKSLLFDNAVMQVLAAKLAVENYMKYTPWDSTEKNQ